MFDLLLFDSIGNLFVQAIARAYNGDFGVGIENIDDASGSDLRFVSMSIPSEVCSDVTYLAAADNKYLFVPDLPGQYQRAPSLDFRKLPLHCEGVW